MTEPPVRVLFATDVVLDVLLRREPFARDAAWLMSRAGRGWIQGLVGAPTVTTAFRRTVEAHGEERARRDLRQLLRLCEVAPVNGSVLRAALERGSDDFEKTILCEAGRQAGAQALVTRQEADFEDAGLPVYTPDALRSALTVT